MFDNMKKSEIKKAEAAANKFSGRKDCKVTGYYAEPSACEGWYDIHCEICFSYEDRAEFDVIVSAMMCDRRRSFATVKTW